MYNKNSQIMFNNINNIIQITREKRYICTISLKIYSY